MSAVEVATGIIDKLQEENRACLDTLHRAQDKIKHQDRQLSEKDRMIKVLEERLRTGNDGILEMTNRQKELTIKHLEMQIQKLLKENEEMELKLDAIKSEICAKCETKLLLRENSENKNISKSYKPTPSTTSKVLFEKKTSHSLCPNRLQSMERIIEHKDKRIMHLSKEVQRLSKTEKELTQKIYRLTKLLPMSRLPSETVTDCLLQEIQLLESEKKVPGSLNEDIFNAKSKSSVSDIVKGKVRMFSDRFNKNSVSNIRKSAPNLLRRISSDEADTTKSENEVLFKKLQKLYNDVNDLKRLFVYESDKLASGLNSTAKEYDQFKIQLEDIINNLNEVVQSILNNNYFQKLSESPLNIVNSESDDKYVISCLQQRLKESLGLVTEYENEIKALNEKLNQLKKELSNKDRVDGISYRSPVSINKIHDTNDVRKLKEVIKIRETQLEAAESHINTCQKFIEELQKTYKHLNVDSLIVPKMSGVASSKKSYSSELQNKELKTKFEVAEKNIKTCEKVIEQLQNTIKQFEDDNDRLETELHMAKSEKINEAIDPKSKVNENSQISVLRKLNLELMEKVKGLEETNSKLASDLKTYENKNAFFEAVEQEKTLLETQLNAAEKHISTLQKTVETEQEKLETVQEKLETVQEKLETVEKINSDLETEIQSINHEKNLAEKYENDVMVLKNELLAKEQENRELKELLYTLESKALEMNHYRKSLHQEIEKLCNALMENDDSGSDISRRKAIYKAAVLHSAQALLRLDDNFNLKQDDSRRNSALEEMKHQIEVYLTEVSRIHELVTIKEHERDELLKEYLDISDDEILQPSSGGRGSNILGQPTGTYLQSASTLHNINNLESDVFSASSKRTKSVKICTEKSEASVELRMLQEEIAATKSVTTYLLSSCTRLEDLLTKEKTEHAKCESELELYKELVQDLKSQLSSKNNITKRLNTLIDMMRSKECNDDLNLEQIKGEMKWVIGENQKLFDRVSTTQSELCHCKEENSRIQNDLDSIKRQLLNEKYEHAKVLNELKHMRIHISQYQSTSSDT